jgi:AICAR transformylase/IMP cyclohydrolase PurH
VFVGFDRIALEADADESVTEILERGRAEQYNKDMKECADARDRMIVAGRRLAIRIGYDQGLYRAYHYAIDVVITCIKHIGSKKREQDAGTPVSSEAFLPWVDTLTDARRAVVTLAVARVGSQLP